MQRTILFRGMRTDNKEWVYGFYYEYNCDSYISSEDHSDNSDTYANDKVIPETLGQFTGLLDAKGNKIFEGDIIRAFDSQNKPVTHDIGYDNHRACFTAYYDGNDCGVNQAWINEFEKEIIGNIHTPL